MSYNWCKECVHRSNSKIETIKDGKREYIRFYCSLDLAEGRTNGCLYHKSDFDAFKISCPGYEPTQISFNDLSLKEG